MAVKTRWIGLCLAVVLALAAGLTPAAAAEKVLRVAHRQDVQSLDPQFGGTLSVEGPLTEMIFNGLVRFPVGTTDLENMEPDLAERWETSDDHRVWTFYLRRGVQFHHGFGELTADDVKFSLERNKTETSPWRASYENVSVEVLDDYTVRVTLDEPDPFFLLSVNNYRGGFIVSRKAVEHYGADFKLNPVGTGPFQFQSHTPRDRVELVRHEQYFRGAPAIERVEWLFMPEPGSRELALRRGSIHMALGEADELWLDALRRQGLQVSLVGPGVTYGAHLNLSNPALQDVRVRRAIMHAINRDEFLAMVGPSLAEAWTSPVPPGYFGHTDDLTHYPYDPDRARALLREAGQENLTLRAIISENPDYRNTAILLQEQLRRVGIDLQLNVVDHTTFHRLIRQNESDIVVYSYSRPPVADVVLSQFFHSDAIVGRPTAITNFINYDRIDDLIERARTAPMEEQLALYAEAQRIIADDAVFAPLYYTLWNVVRQPSVKLGVPDRVNSLNYFVPINENTDLDL